MIGREGWGVACLECFFCMVQAPNRDLILGSRDSLLELFCVINEEVFRDESCGKSAVNLRRIIAGKFRLLPRILVPIGRYYNPPGFRTILVPCAFVLVNACSSGTAELCPDMHLGKKARR